MQTKFRPIITESARKANSKESNLSEAVSTKVVKPIAISVWAKPSNDLPPLLLHETENNKPSIFRPFAVVGRLNSSQDNHSPDTSAAKEQGLLNAQKSVPLSPIRTVDTYAITKRVRSLGDIAEAANLDTSKSNQEEGFARYPEQNNLNDLEEGRSESSNSAEQVGTTNTPHSNVTTLDKETQPYAPSNDSDLQSCERDSIDATMQDREVHEGVPCEAKLELDSDKSSHRHRNVATARSLPISNGTASKELHKPSSEDSNSLRETKVKKRISNEVPLFSEVLESEDSGQSDAQEDVQNKDGTEDSIPAPLSPTLSNAESCDKDGARPQLRESSSGDRVSLRRFERKLSSDSGFGDSSENPWFQNRCSSKEDDDVEQRSINGNETRKPSKEKKKKISRLSRIFRSVKSREKNEKDDSIALFAEELSSRASGSEDSSVPTQDVNTSRDTSEIHLEETLSLAISGRRSLEEVTDALLGLSGRPCDKVMKLLLKYMCSTVVIDSAFRVILEHEHAKKADIPMKSVAPSHTRYSPHREALINLFANGPERLKRALLNHNKARSEIFRFFTEERPEGDVEVPYWISTATSLSKLLNGLLAQFPAELTEYIGAKKGLLHLMVKNHVHVPEVVEFVIQLSAANALSKTTGEDLRYGAVNATGLVLLVKEGICDLLIDIFQKSSVATAQGDVHTLEWQTQVQSTHCLLELSKRAIVIPRFSKDNCSYSGRYIKTLNSSLDDLSMYTHDDRVLSLLNAGFDAISDGPVIENDQEQSQRNNPLVCALEVITELLETVRVGAGSKLAVTRKTVGSTSTEKIEKHLVSKMARLCKLLHRKSAHEVSCRAKVAIVNMFRWLCSSNVLSTRLSMVKSQIPDRLMVLIRENEDSSVLHSCVLKCFSESFKSSHSTELHKEWLRSLARSDGWLQVMYEHFHDDEGGEKHGSKPFFNTFVAIGFSLMEFSQDDKEAKLGPMVKSKGEMETFVDSIEGGLIRMRKEYETPCGGPKPSERAVSVLANAETLAARLHDFNAV